MSLRLLFAVNAPRNFLLKRQRLAEDARDAGFEVHVACPDHPDRARIEDLGFPVHGFRFDRRGTNPLKESTTVVSLARLYRRLEPDLVHHFTLKVVTHGGIAGRVSGVPGIVHTVTGLGTVFLTDGMAGGLLRSAVGSAIRFGHRREDQVYVFQNQDDLDLLRNDGLVSRDTSRLILGSGVDTSRFRPSPEPDGPPVIGVVSRMLEDKGIVEFVEAARSLRDRVDARFVLVGDTDPANPSAIPREQLEAWDREEAIEWWGWRDDVEEVYRSLHVLCLPSYREGLPKSPIEAAASGRPLVLTDVPGCREVVEHGENGLLVPPKDPSALAEALERLISSPEERSTMGKRSREMVEEKFAMEKVNQRYLEVYRELLDGTNASG